LKSDYNSNNVYTSAKIFNDDYTPMEKEMILLCINSQKFDSELDFEDRIEESQNNSRRKCALIATPTVKC